MKRIVVILLALMLLAGCAGRESASPQVQPNAPAAPAAEPAPAEAAAEPLPTEAPARRELAQELVDAWDGAGLLDGMYQMEPGDVLDYYGVDVSACLGSAFFMDAVGYTNEAVVLEAEGSVLDEAEALLQAHLDSVKAQFRGYDPEALALAEKAVFLREGDLLLFIIAPQAEDMLAVYRTLAD